MFISMRTILFIGGLAADKHLFALVNEDPTTKVRRCHIFRAPEPVWIQGCCFHLMLAVDCNHAGHSKGVHGLQEAVGATPARIIVVLLALGFSERQIFYCSLP
jgi:hypothetical protein